MIELAAQDVNTLIGWAAAPLMLVALISHIKGLLAAMPWTVKKPDSENAWAPFAVDVLAVGYVKLMALDGRLQIDGTVGWPTIILLGIALGVLTGKAYDLWTGRKQGS